MSDAFGRKSTSAGTAGEIAVRVLAASVGAYAVTYEATAVVAKALPWDKLSAVIVSTNLAFFMMVSLVLWSFCGRSAKIVVAIMSATFVGLTVLDRIVGL